METITEEKAVAVWRETEEMSPEEGNREMTALSKSQPEILAFLVHATDDMDPDAAEFAVYVVFVLYKMFQQGGRPLKKVTADDLVERHKHNMSLMENLVGSRGGFAQTVGSIDLPVQPVVMRFIAEAIIGAPRSEEPLTLSDEDAYYLFFLFKTVAEALDAKGQQ